MSNKLYDEMLPRLDAFIKHKELSWNKFGKIAGFASGAVWRIMIEKKVFGTDKLLNIFEAFPELNCNWLLFQEGPMILTEEERTARNLRDDALSSSGINPGENTIEAFQRRIRELERSNAELKIKNKAYLEAMKAMSANTQAEEEATA